jgi:hypothetical protein
VIEPQRRIDEPLRRALDAILVRWLGLYVLAGTSAALPLLCRVDHAHMALWRAALPLFLLGFIAVHLVHRHRARRDDGWERAMRADAGTARVALSVGLAGLFAVALALVAIFCPYESPLEAIALLGIWAPILVPLYAVSAWVAIDCARRRLAASADEADRRLREYWQGVAAQR